MTGHPTSPGTWPLAFAGLSATLVGNGIARFAYTPLIPALIAAGWFSPPEAAYLAAANLAGYLVGALGARRLALALGASRTMRAAMLVTIVSLAACAWNFGFGWYLGWRFLAGVTGGVLMVLAAPMALAGAVPRLRGRVSGIVFTGVGAGIAAAGTLVPALARHGLPTVWLALAATAALLTIYVWIVLPRGADGPDLSAAASFRPDASIALLLAAYALDALGFIPHTVFWVDFIARELGQGLTAGGGYWIVFGAGATAGPFLVGLLADRAGFGAAFIAAMAVKAAAVAIPLFSTSTAALALSSIVVGALITGTTALCSGWVAERVGLSHHRQVWGWMTSAFAVAQAGGAWGMSYLFAGTGSYALLFLLGTVALMAGAGMAWVSARVHAASPGRG